MGGESPAPADAAKNSEDSALHSEWEFGNGDGVEVSIEENRCLERARHSSVVEMTVTCEPEPSVEKVAHLQAWLPGGEDDGGGVGVVPERMRCALGDGERFPGGEDLSLLTCFQSDGSRGDTEALGSTGMDVRRWTGGLGEDGQLDLKVVACLEEAHGFPMYRVVNHISAARHPQLPASD